MAQKELLGSREEEERTRCSGRRKSLEEEDGGREP